MKAAQKNQTVSVILPVDVVEALEAEARAEVRSFSAQVRKIIIDWLAARPQRARVVASPGRRDK